MAGSPYDRTGFWSLNLDVGRVEDGRRSLGSHGRVCGDLAIATSTGEWTYTICWVRSTRGAAGYGRLASRQRRRHGGGRLRPGTIAAFLALTAEGTTVVPLSRDSQVHAEAFVELAQVNGGFLFVRRLTNRRTLLGRSLEGQQR